MGPILVLTFEFTNLLVLYWLDWLKGMVKSKAQKSSSVWGKGLTLSHSFLLICLFLFLFYCFNIFFASWLFSFHDRLLELLSCFLFMGLCFWACMRVHASCMYMHTRNMHMHTLGGCACIPCVCAIMFVPRNSDLGFLLFSLFSLLLSHV